jgi:hypothetical protein
MSETRVIDWKDPKTFGLPASAYERYKNDNTQLHNSIARKNHNVPMLVAMADHIGGSHDTTKIDGKSIDEIISEL